MEEIKSDTFVLGADKAPWPILFFQKLWSVINNDLFALCQDSYKGTTNLEHINWVSIVLIPKVKSP